MKITGIWIEIYSEYGFHLSKNLLKEIFEREVEETSDENMSYQQDREIIVNVYQTFFYVPWDTAMQMC